MTRQVGLVVEILSFAPAAAAQFTQQGSELVGRGAVGAARQGASAAISPDGNAAVLGGYYDNSQAGAAWAHTRSGGVWSKPTVLVRLVARVTARRTR